MAFELAHNMFKVVSICSFVSVEWGDVLSLCNPSKEMDTWKGKDETMELRCITLHKELVTL